MNKTYRSTRSLTLIFLFAVLAALSQTVPAQGKKKIVYYSIKAGTVFRVRIETTLNSAASQVGHTFSTTTVDPVYSTSGVQLIPAGSTIHGRVTSAVPAAKNGKPGTIDVTFTSITLPNGAKHSINGTLTSLEAGGTTSDNEGTASGTKTSKRNLKFIGGGAAGGAIIGGIAGGGTGALVGGAIGAVGGAIGKRHSKGPEAEVKKGTEFGIYLNQQISLPRYR